MNQKQREHDLEFLAEQAEQIRSQLEAIFQSVNEGIVVFDAAGNAILVNEMEAKICGYDSPEEMKKNLQYFTEIFEILYPDYTPVPVSEWPVSRVLRGETIKDWELRGRRKDTGQEWFFSFSGSPIIKDNKTELSVIITRDITNQKRIEDSLRDSEIRFRALADNIPQLSWMADASGHIFWYNQRWYDYTGTNLEEMEGWGWKKVHHPEHVDRVVDIWSRHLKEGVSWEDTFPLKGKDGHYRWFLSRATPVKNKEGTIIRWFGTNTDVTEQLQVQENLKIAIEARDEFLSIASHELKTPLTSLLLQVQMFERAHLRGDQEVFRPENVAKFVYKTKLQTQRLSKLVDDMLDISRIRAGKVAIQKVELDICALVKDTVEKLKDILVQADAFPKLNCEGKIIGRWDPSRLEQVITNLLTNAMKYGEGRPIEIHVRREGDRAVIAVRDHGIGLSKELQKKIFEKFERAISSSEVSGLGLGLFISKHIIEAHGGKIWAESAGAGLGTTFYVQLPL